MNIAVFGSQTESTAAYLDYLKKSIDEQPEDARDNMHIIPSFEEGLQTINQLGVYGENVIGICVLSKKDDLREYIKKIFPLSGYMKAGNVRLIIVATYKLEPKVEAAFMSLNVSDILMDPIKTRSFDYKIKTLRKVFESYKTRDTLAANTKEFRSTGKTAQDGDKFVDLTSRSQKSNNLEFIKANLKNFQDSNPYYSIWKKTSSGVIEKGSVRGIRLKGPNNKDGTWKKISDLQNGEARWQFFPTQPPIPKFLWMFSGFEPTWVNEEWMFAGTNPQLELVAANGKSVASKIRTKNGKIECNDELEETPDMSSLLEEDSAKEPNAISQPNGNAKDLVGNFGKTEHLRDLTGNQGIAPIPKDRELLTKEAETPEMEIKTESPRISEIRGHARTDTLKSIHGKIKKTTDKRPDFLPTKKTKEIEHNGPLELEPLISVRKVDLLENGNSFPKVIQELIVFLASLSPPLKISLGNITQNNILFSQIENITVGSSMTSAVPKDGFFSIDSKHFRVVLQDHFEINEPIKYLEYLQDTLMPLLEKSHQ